MQMSCRPEIHLQISCWSLLVLGKGQTRLAVPSQGAQWAYEQTNPWSFTETEEADWVLEGHSRLLCRLGATGAWSRKMEVDR